MSERQQNRQTEYECQRCGQKFFQKSHYGRHIERKRMCKPSSPSRDSVTPSMDNVKVVKRCGGHEVTVILNDSHNNNISVDASCRIESHVHHHTHVHKTVNIMAFGKEDKSFLTPELIKALINQTNLAEDDPINTVVRLVEYVHFNPTKPENMNVFALDNTKASANSAKMFNGSRWVVMDKNDVAARVASAHTKLIKESIAMSDVDEQSKEEYSCLDDNSETDWDLLEKTLDAIRSSSFLVSLHHPEVLSGVDRYSILGMTPLGFK